MSTVVVLVEIMAASSAILEAIFGFRVCLFGFEICQVGSRYFYSYLWRVGEIELSNGWWRRHRRRSGRGGAGDLYCELQGQGEILLFSIPLDNIPNNENRIGNRRVEERLDASWEKDEGGLSELRNVYR